MNLFFKTFITTFMSRTMYLWGRLRTLMSPVYWRTKGSQKLRDGFLKIFSIKPKHPKDYYKIFSWLVSRKLAFAVIIGAGILSVWYLAVMSPLAARTDSSEKIPTFYYRSMPLKFFKGEARILDKERITAYIGNVKSGNAEGAGIVYLKNGTPLYSGQLAANKYEGSGKLYYEDGTPLYEGFFSQNLFHGKGRHFRTTGTTDYYGDWAFGLREGVGTMYNAGENVIFEGLFSNDRIVFQQLVGKTTIELGSMYTGKTITYEYDAEIPEYVGVMEEINAVYAAKSGDNTIDGEWMVSEIFVLEPYFTMGTTKIENVSGLSAVLGSSIYEGETNVMLSEAVAMNKLELLIELSAESVFDNVYAVIGYETAKEIYISTYLYEDILYSFFMDSKNADNFFMYSLSEKVGL